LLWFEVDRSVVEFGVSLFDLLLGFDGFGLLGLFGGFFLLVFLFLIFLDRLLFGLGRGFALGKIKVDDFSDSVRLLLFGVFGLTPAH
jgi:hypothetical protein